MSILFSRACEYALLALIEMARHPGKKSWTISELANQTDTPAPFLAKTFQTLVKNDILDSQKGRQGGFSIKKPVNQILLWDIINTIDGESITQDCVLAFPGCGEDNPCPFHNEWAEVCTAISQKLRNHTLEQLASRQ